MARIKPRIGLLGGSFNPAHDGHVHLSLHALKTLQLDDVWWLVSPQNPLKEASSLTDYGTRLTHAEILAGPYPHIHVSDYEDQHHLFYSYDTVRSLLSHYPQSDFVWLMGADNLACFHRWRNWDRLFHALPIAVFDRSPFSHCALRSKAAIRFDAFRIAQTQAPLLTKTTPPAWSYIHMPRHPAEATAIRKKLGKDGFLRHNESVSNQ